MAEQNKHAVVIGVNEYQDHNIPKLLGAVNDATEIRKRLIEFGDFKIPDEHFLVNEYATGGAIRKAMSDVLWKTDPYDLVLFYFSGHGISDGYSNGYIAPYDMLGNEPFVNGINMEELKKLVMRSQNKQCVVVILDCCFSGVSTKGERAVPDGADSFDTYFCDLKDAGEGKIIIASSGENQKARELELPLFEGMPPMPYGAFSYHLIEGLDGRAANEGGIVTLDLLYAYVEKQLLASKGQKPHIYAAGASQMGNIQIAITTDKFRSYIEGKLDEAKWKADSDYIGDLVIAAQDVCCVLQNDNDNAEAIELREKIAVSLQEYDNQVIVWIDENLDLKPTFKEVFRELEDLSGSLKIEDICKLDRRGQQLLYGLCEVSSGKMRRDTFIGKLRMWSNLPGIKKTTFMERRGAA